jgi:hypothetical protein
MTPPSKMTKAELLDEVRTLRAELVVMTAELERVNEEFDYLTPEELTALEKFHREEISVWAYVAQTFFNEGCTEEAERITTTVVDVHRRHASNYALRAATRTVEWDNEPAESAESS